MPTHPPEPFAMVVSQAFYGFSRFCAAEAWSPAVNVYQLKGRLEVCVDLAGIDREAIDVRVEPRRLTVRGVRAAPDPPTHDDDSPMRIVTMEIDYGPFCRSITIPDRVDLRKVESAYRDGMLWITLPLKPRR